MRILLLAPFALCWPHAAGAQDIPNEIDGRQVIARGISYDFPAEMRSAVDHYSKCMMAQRSRSRTSAVEGTQRAIKACQKDRSAAHEEASLALAHSPEWRDQPLRDAEITSVFDKMEASALKQAAESDAYLREFFKKGRM